MWSIKLLGVLAGVANITLAIWQHNVHAVLGWSGVTLMLIIALAAEGYGR
jgi:hypothetical protein